MSLLRGLMSKTRNFFFNVTHLHLWTRVSVFYLINKRVVHEVRTPNTEVENVNLLQDGVVKSIKEPRGVWNLGGKEKQIRQSLHCLRMQRKRRKMEQQHAVHLDSFQGAHKKTGNVADCEIPLASTKLTVSELDKSHAICKLCHTKIKSRCIIIVSPWIVLNLNLLVLRDSRP